jgi:hypothetical protein
MAGSGELSPSLAVNEIGDGDFVMSAPGFPARETRAFLFAGFYSSNFRFAVFASAAKQSSAV